jgi:uncharacterized membrane protein YbhN (UPF0104 family)
VAEFVRPYVLSSQQGVDFRTTLAVTVAEWLLDALAVLALFVPALLWLHAGGRDEPWAAGTFVLALSLAGLGLLRVLSRRAAGVAGWIESRRGLSARARVRLAGWWQSFVAGLRALEGARGLVTAGAYSTLLSVLIAMSAWVTLRAFDLHLSLASGFVLLGVVTIAGMIPTPGAIGGFHAACQVGLVTFFGIDVAHTVLPVIALHAVFYLPGAFLGTVCFLSWPARRRRRS